MKNINKEEEHPYPEPNPILMVEKQQVEENILIAERIKPGDKWVLLSDSAIYNSLTETLEAYYQSGKHIDYYSSTSPAFRVEPSSGKIYVIKTQEITITPPKTFNMYGDY